MEEKLISYETAKVAHQKGFNVACDMYWYGEEEENMHLASVYGYTSSTNISSKFVYHCPTQDFLQQWFREVHKIHIMITVNADNEGFDPTVWSYGIISRYDNALHDDAFSMVADEEFPSYEEALEKALQVALELIL